MVEDLDKKENIIYAIGDNGLYILKNDLIDDVDSDPGKTSTYYLYQNYPNPFNPVTNINYILHNTEFVVLKVYDVLGNEIKTLVNEEQPSGSYSLQFNASGLSSGVYFYRMQAGNFSDTRKFILMK